MVIRDINQSLYVTIGNESAFQQDLPNILILLPELLDENKKKAHKFKKDMDERLSGKSNSLGKNETFLIIKDEIIGSHTKTASRANGVVFAYDMVLNSIFPLSAFEMAYRGVTEEGLVYKIDPSPSSEKVNVLKPKGGI